MKRPHSTAAIEFAKGSGKRRGAPRRFVLLGLGLTTLAMASQMPQAPLAGPHVLGPFAPMLAEVQWVRAYTARDQGENARAFALMHSALSLQPSSSSAWITLANQLGLQLASAESGRPADERADWLRAALATLQQGEAFALHPENLALHQAILLLSYAETDDALPWPGGVPGLYRDAALAGERALELAHQRAQVSGDDPNAHHAEHLEWEAMVRGLVDSSKRASGL